MIVAAALSLSISLAAPGDKLPYPAPRLAPVTDRLKCDTATILTVNWEKNTVQATATAGVVTYRAGMDAQVLDRQGNPLGAVSKLSPGDKVRIYYLVEDGARVLEIDQE